MFSNYPHDALFRGKYWNDLVTAKKEAMYDEIRKLDPDIFEANTIEEIKRNIFEKYLLEEIVLLKDSAEQKFIEQDVRRFDDFEEAIGHDPYVDVPGYKIVVDVPFNGSDELLKVTPTMFSSTYHKGDVFGHVISIGFEFAEHEVDDEGKTIKAAIEKTISDLESDAKTINADVIKYNTEIKNDISRYVDGRLQKINKIKNIKTSLKIPITSVHKGLSNRISIITKKSSPLTHKKGDADAYISDNDYEAILETIRAAGQIMETNTATNGHGEESIRDIFLTCLNSSFLPGEGFAGGELFRGKGKTDICIPFENRSAFIAECKLWKGEKYIDEGINQLEGYSTWRDAKIAMLIFNKGIKNFSQIQSKIDGIFKNRADFVKEEVQREGEWRFELQKPDDEFRHIKIHVFAFDFK